jgi:predicted site-specific integrase-resolvase
MHSHIVLEIKRPFEGEELTQVGYARVSSSGQKLDVQPENYNVREASGADLYEKVERPRSNASRIEALPQLSA